MGQNSAFRPVAVARARRGAEELPPDNTARIVLYDAMAEAAQLEYGFDGLTQADLFDLVISRLRVLVPRELHNLGEQSYVAAKIEACVAEGILHPLSDGALRLGLNVPRIRYPDRTIRDYTAGLEAARERLDADENRLRRGGFDVRRLVGSPADAKKSDRYRTLVGSMREHGFLDGFPIIEGASGVVDGVARLAAAVEADVQLKKHHRVKLSPRRDTPLQLALLVLDVNADRLREDEVAKVHDVIADRIGRSWLAIESDLDVTRDWRRAEPKDYGATLDVELVRFRDHNEPKVQITTDGTRIALRSLTREAGIPEWGRDHLLPHVPFEEARALSRGGGRKAIFVRVTDAIDGIERMKRDRARRGLQTDLAWDDVRQWLLSLDSGGSTGESTGTATQPTLGGMEPPTGE
jgi:hypothetical protein